MRTDDLNTEKSREKLDFLSLKTLHFLKICSPLSHCQILAKMEKRCLLLSPYCHMSSHHWLIWISYPLILLPLIFLQLGDATCPLGPTLELKLTHFAPDTWHTMSHSKCVKCLALRSLPQKTCKFRLSRNSTKFYVVARFLKTIPTVKFILSFEI